MGVARSSGAIPLGGCQAGLPYVEFYLVGKDFDWLLAENHHGGIWLL